MSDAEDSIGAVTPSHDDLDIPGCHVDAMVTADAAAALAPTGSVDGNDAINVTDDEHEGDEVVQPAEMAQGAVANIDNQTLLPHRCPSPPAAIPGADSQPDATRLSPAPLVPAPSSSQMSSVVDAVAATPRPAACRVDDVEASASTSKQPETQQPMPLAARLGCHAVTAVALIMMLSSIGLLAALASESYRMDLPVPVYCTFGVMFTMALIPCLFITTCTLAPRDAVNKDGVSSEAFYCVRFAFFIISSLLFLGMLLPVVEPTSCHHDPHVYPQVCHVVDIATTDVRGQAQPQSVHLVRYANATGATCMAYLTQHSLHLVPGATLPCCTTHATACAAGAAAVSVAAVPSSADSASLLDDKLSPRARYPTISPMANLSGFLMTITTLLVSLCCLACLYAAMVVLLEKSHPDRLKRQREEKKKKRKRAKSLKRSLKCCKICTEAFDGD